MVEEYALIGPGNAVVRIETANRINPNVPTRSGWRWVPVETEAEPTATALQSVSGEDVVEENRLLRRRIAMAKSLEEQRAAVNAERDRRLGRFPFGNRHYDFGGQSTVDIAGAGTLALAAIIGGAQPGNLRWADPNADFRWIAADNTSVTMDAQTCFGFAQAAAKWRASHIHIARALKDMSPIPADYASDARWPA